MQSATSRRNADSENARRWACFSTTLTRLVALLLEARKLQRPLTCVQEKMMELQAKLGKLNAEKVELERRKHLLSSACQLRDEELSKARQHAQT